MDDHNAEMRELAINIVFGSDTNWWPIEDRVDYFCDTYPEDLPAWFSTEHRRELVKLIEQF